jgi:hypothetical protein
MSAARGVPPRVLVRVRAGQLAAEDVAGVGAHEQDEGELGVVRRTALEVLGEEEPLARAGGDTMCCETWPNCGRRPTGSVKATRGARVAVAVGVCACRVLSCAQSL